ncbi:M48 family metallopeptidase [Bdellovibrio svalbardensis]|uniref:M48 family metallopeptidase n=1 Tax=Bdellovibrio svalbardensis TaxID=2972972 RepID=A0ABT6DIY1_9BACT|nr:M48 family metallopeptidase [Bdellovibrio svalbardensis]MDG0816474.1 M48 family metallopeptidase [Bdellovibrio svalbardensis]
MGSAAMKSYSATKTKKSLTTLLEKSGVTQSELNDYDLELTSLCPKVSTLNNSELGQALQQVCTLDNDLENFEIACIIVSGTLFITLLLFAVMGWATKFSRMLHLLSFKFGIFAFTFLVCGSVIANAAILVSASYFIPSYFIGYYLPKLTGILALGAAYLVFQICKNSLGLIRSSTLTVVAKRMFPSEQPKLWEEVRKIAIEAGVQPPNNILIGLEPNFFVTECSVNTLDGLCKGRSLFISASIVKSLSLDEFKSILLHEFGHFKGLDTLFSIHYSPIFKRLENTQSLLESAGQNINNNVGYIAALPTTIMVSFFNLCFRSSHAHHNRTREESADDLAVNLTSNRIFASALIKSVAIGAFWSPIHDKIKSLAEEKRVLSNIPLALRNLFSTVNSEDVRILVNDEDQMHPFDSHPPLINRVTRVGVDFQSITTEPPAVTAECLIDKSNELEEELSTIRYGQLGRQGFIDLDKLFEPESA